MQRYSQADKLLFTADQRSMAFSGLMLPDTIVASLEGFGQAPLAVPLEFPQLWPMPDSSPAAAPAKTVDRAKRTSANKHEMRGGPLRPCP